MKKLIFLTVLTLLLSSMLISCGKEDAPDTPDTNETIAETAAETEAPFGGKDFSAYDAYTIFKAPEGNPRDIVYDYMMKMATVEWVAPESWTTTWKETAQFPVDIEYKAGKTYYGIPYSDTKCGLSVFENYIVDGKFQLNSPYYEELIGNHCSSSMGLAYQQIINFPYEGDLRANTARQGIIRLADNLETPPSRTEGNPDDWISSTVTAHNGQEKIFEAYTTLGKGDILYRIIDGYGHTRMVSKVEVSRTAVGKISPSRSYVYCLEQTNAWADSKRNSTWFIDRKYSFSDLANNDFTPLTLCIFHEENPTYEDAYITFTGKNTAATITKMLDGTVESNFPINFVRTFITDENGKIVGDTLKHSFRKTYKVSVRDMTYKLGADKLPAGKYTFTLQTAIARGSWNAETVEFTIE